MVVKKLLYVFFIYMAYLAPSLPLYTSLHTHLMGVIIIDELKCTEPPLTKKGLEHFYFPLSTATQSLSRLCQMALSTCGSTTCMFDLLPLLLHLYKKISIFLNILSHIYFLTKYLFNSVGLIA